MYYTFHEMVMIHFLLGIGIAIVAEVVASRLNKPRFLFVWDEKPFSKRVWQKWYLFAYVLEALTSLFWFSAGMMYVELAYSVWQAALMVIGAFIVDRAIVVFNADPEPATTARVYDLKAFADKYASVVRNMNAKEAKVEPVIDPEVKKHEEQNFDDLIRGH